MMPLQGFKPVLGALLLGQLRTPGAAMTRLPPRRSTGAAPVPPRSRLGASPASRSNGDGSVPAGSELPRVWEGERPPRTLAPCFPSEAAGSKRVASDERG